jgi:dolichyldiphosphatase
LSCKHAYIDHSKYFTAAYTDDSMGSLDPNTALSPLPPLKSFALTHILYDPAHPLSIPFTLLSLTPIFLFVSYFTLWIFDRRLTVLALAAGSIANEILSLGLKRVLKGERPYMGFGEVGDGYGMPSSHSQAAGFLVAWGVGYWMTLGRRRLAVRTRAGKSVGAKLVGKVRRTFYLLGLVAWSLLVAYSR